MSRRSADPALGIRPGAESGIASGHLRQRPGALSTSISDRSEICRHGSAAAVLSNFPLTDTSGYRSLALQVTSIAAGSTIVAEESNDGAAWTALTSVATGRGLDHGHWACTSIISAAKQIRVRQSVYGGSGSSGTGEFRLSCR
jgi:hypothetical protein